MKRMSSPYVVMGIVLAMYAIKVCTKLGVGYSINSPMVIGDGWHNVSDIFEALLVIFMVWFAARPRSEEYPFGRKNAESLVSAAIGGMLIFLSLKLAAESVLGLLSWIPSLTDAIDAINWFHRDALVIGEPGSGLFWLALGVTGGSGILSLAIGYYQISVGRRGGHEALVADGRETWSDSCIEFVTCAGVLSEYFLHQPNLEYVFTLAVAVKLALTGKELFFKGFHALLQRSLEPDAMLAIRDEVVATCGVAKLADLKAFRIGDVAIIIMKLHTRASLAATRQMKKSLAVRIAKRLQEFGLAGADPYIRFDAPTPDWHRDAYAIVSIDGEEKIAGSIASADRLRFCNVPDGDVRRASDTTIPAELPRIVALLARKKVRTVLVCGEGDEREAMACQAAGIGYRSVSFDAPRVYGCARRRR